MASISIHERFINPSDQEFKHWLKSTNTPLDDELFTAMKEKAEFLANHGDLSQALRLLERSLVAAEQKGTPINQALLWRARANVLQHHEQYEASLAASTKAAALYQQHGTELDVAKAKTVEVAVLAAMGEWDKAEELGRWIQKQFEAHEFTLGLARVTHGLAHTYRSSWQLEKAHQEYMRAKALFTELDLPADLAWINHNLGNLAFDSDQIAEAIQYYLSSQPLFVEMGDVILLVKTEFNLARCFVRLAQYEQALTHLEQARNLLKQLPNSPDHGYVDLHEAQVRRHLNQLTQAEALLQHALAHFRRNQYQLEEAEALFELGHLAAAENEPSRLAVAVDYFEQAAQCVTDQNIPLFLAWVRLEQAELLLRLARLREAHDLAQLVYAQFDAAGLVLRSAQAKIILSHCNEHLRPKEAERQYREVLAELSRDPSLHSARCWHGIGRLAARRGELSQAEEAYRNAIEILEKLRHTLKSHSHQSGFLEDKQTLFAELLQALYQQPNSRHKIVNWLERINASALVELLNDISSNTQVTHELQALLEERATVASILDQRLDATQYHGIHLAVGGHRRQIAHFDQTNVEIVANLSRKLQLIDERIMRQQSRDTDWRAEKSLMVESIQLLLDDQTLLIYYCVIQGELHVVTMTNIQDDIRVYPMSSTLQDVATQWLQTQRLILRYQTANARVQNRLAVLYQLLVGPLQEQMQTRSRLIIVPFRSLARIPYAALYNVERQLFLGESHAIQITPSASVLQLCHAQRRATDSPLLIGYPGESGHPSYLLHVADEISMLDTLLPASRTLYGENATVDQVNSLMPQSRIIHVAGHAYYDSEAPLNSGIPLADGRWLRARDLYLQPGKLNGSLVVLSGCSTGRGLASGMDILGFTSAFLYAGATSVLTTLWPIDDQATSLFMRHFYHALTTSQCETVDALQLAQRAMLANDEYRAPYFWAPFMLTGASRSPYMHA